MKIFAILFLISTSIFAQKKQTSIYTIYINYPEYSLKAEIISQKKKIQAEENLIYNWYASNAIMQTQGGYEGKLLNGNYTSFYLSNNLKEQGKFKNGLKTGRWISWYVNGLIQEITNWSNGLRSGLHEQYNEKGRLLLREEYKNNKLNGYRLTYANDTVSAKQEYKKGIEAIVLPKQVGESDKNKPRFFTKIKKVFSKKEKKIAVADKKQNTPKNNPTKAHKSTTPKKTLKEKLQSLFKKKESTPKKEATANPSANK